jgi:hypothetical protein
MELVQQAGRLGLSIDPAHLGRTLMAVYGEHGVQIRPHCGRRVVPTPAQRHRTIAELATLGHHAGA